MGKALYEMESTEEGAQSTQSSSPAASSVTTANTTSSDHKEDDHHTGRTPLIRFVGKRPHVKQETTLAPPQVKAAVVAAAVVKKASSTLASDSWPQPSKPQTGVDFTSLKGGAQYGRPLLSQKEIDAIESGGAY